MKDHVLEALDFLLDIYDRSKETPEKYAVKTAASD
jgi:hypothetical protein